jgi:4-hydroxy-tetrahydrodipicolinate reductase
MILMMRYAKDAARYFSNIEIIEMHHEKKKDAPSGTAYQTAALIAKNRQSLPSTTTELIDIIPGCRGGHHHGIPIHSVRLPGLLAHQMVIFGHEGETLTLRADTLSRDSYQQGILLACRQVMTLNELVVGLNP